MLLMTCCFGGSGKGGARADIRYSYRSSPRLLSACPHKQQEQGVPVPAVFHTLVDKRIKPMQMLTYYSDSNSPFIRLSSLPSHHTVREPTGPGYSCRNACRKWLSRVY